MTLAEQIVSGKVEAPEFVEKATAEVLAVAQAAHDGVEENLYSRHYVRLHRANSGGEMTVEEAEEAAEETAADFKENATYAYQFLECDDGSALAVYVTKHGEDAALKAFPSIQHARYFHPIRNVAGEE